MRRWRLTAAAGAAALLVGCGTVQIAPKPVFPKPLVEQLPAYLENVIRVLAAGNTLDEALDWMGRAGIGTVCLPANCQRDLRPVWQAQQSGWHVRRGVEHAGDGRIVTIAATERGRRIHSEVQARRRDVILTVLEAFPDDERFLLAEFLERFSHAVDETVKAKKRRR